MSREPYYGRPEGQSVPYFVNGQHYYDYKQDYYRDETDPRLLEFLEDFGELYNRRHELFHKIFPDSREDFRTALDEVLNEARSKRRTRVGTVQRSLSIGSPRVRCRGLGGDDDVLRLHRFKVKTVDLEDEEDGDPVVTTTSASSKRRI